MLKDGEGDERFEVGVLRYRCTQSPGIGMSSSISSPWVVVSREEVRARDKLDAVRDGMGGGWAIMVGTTRGKGRETSSSGACESVANDQYRCLLSSIRSY
jgi:hypothetical protein